MYRPHVAILLMCVSRKMRCVNFRGLTGSQRTPRVWGVTEPLDIRPQAFMRALLYGQQVIITQLLVCSGFDELGDERDGEFFE